jgi:UDPglucose 6-dehydrogenase
MAKPVLVDLRNIYRAPKVMRHGFTYEGIGRARNRGSARITTQCVAGATASGRFRGTYAL